MTEDQWLILGVALTFFPSILFTLGVGLLSPWWRTRTGRAIFILSLSLTVLTGTGLLRIFIGDDSQVFTYTRLAIYTLLPLGLWYKCYAFFRVLVRANSKQRGDSRVGNVDWDIEHSKHRRPRT